jgi:2-polyprenyl-3-methyl-5-hydroxy-6-metoxy-1,4-benzoquinol methylase
MILRPYETYDILDSSPESCSKNLLIVLAELFRFSFKLKNLKNFFFLKLLIFFSSLQDVGSGGGILSERLARLGANVTGIDPVQV